MGLTAQVIVDLIDLKRRGVTDGFTRVVEIGAQQLADQFLAAGRELDELYALYGVPRIDLGLPVGAEHFAERAPPSRAFWQSLGFEYAAIEYGGYRDSIALDLNHDAVPSKMRGAFDLVINGGTTEHVANQQNAFRIMHDLVRPNGIMMHHVPTQGYVEHGLVNYNPKFFWYLCRENEYDALSIKFGWGEPVAVPDHVLAVSGGTPDSTLRDCMLIVVVRKRHDAPFAPPLDLPDAIRRPPPPVPAPAPGSWSVRRFLPGFWRSK